MGPSNDVTVAMDISMGGGHAPLRAASLPTATPAACPVLLESRGAFSQVGNFAAFPCRQARVAGSGSCGGKERPFG